MCVITSARILKCSNFRMLESNVEIFEWFNALKLASSTGVCSFACFLFMLWYCSFLKCWWQENENTPTKHFEKNAKYLKIWRKEKVTKMLRGKEWNQCKGNQC